MSRVNQEQNRLDGSQLFSNSKMGVLAQALTGTFSINKSMPTLLFLDCNGSARNVDFPVVTADMRGLFFVIKNTSGTAVAITLRNSAAATIGDLAQSESCMVVCDGTAFHVLMVGTST